MISTLTPTTFCGMNGKSFQVGLNLKSSFSDDVKSLPRKSKLALEAVEYANGDCG